MHYSLDSLCQVSFLCWQTWRLCFTLCLLSSLILSHRDEGTHALGSFWGSTIRRVYEEVGEHFPALDPMVDAEIGVSRLLQTSKAFKREKEFCFAVLTGREHDRQPAEPMYYSDLMQILRGTPPTPAGYRSGAYLTIAHELGHRPAMFLMAYPDNVHLLQNGVWRFDGLFDVKTTNNYKDYNLDPLSAEWVDHFKRTEGMRVWASPNNAFHYANVCHLDMDIKERTIDGGYLRGYFSSYSVRRGCVSELVGNKMFQGHSKVDAIDFAREKIGWAIAGDTVQDYLSPLSK